MKMSIARALKERKRVIGEMNTLRQRIESVNAVQLTVRTVDGKYDKPTREELDKKRAFDPRKCMESWYGLRDRLISIKTALHAANSGVVEKLVRLGELKAELQAVKCMTSYPSDESIFVNDNTIRVMDVIYDATWIIKRQDELSAEINGLQDEIDEYNATHYVELPD